MSVSGEGSGVAGTSYSLTCTVRLPLGVDQVSPNIQWKRPKMPFTQALSTTHNPLLFTTTLHLSSLQSSDAGEYLCQASYSLGGHTSPLLESYITLSVKSKLQILSKTRQNFHNCRQNNSSSDVNFCSNHPTRANRASGVRGGSVSEE